MKACWAGGAQEFAGGRNNAAAAQGSGLEANETFIPKNCRDRFRSRPSLTDYAVERRGPLSRLRSGNDCVRCNESQATAAKQHRDSENGVWRCLGLRQPAQDPQEPETPGAQEHEGMAGPRVRRRSLRPGDNQPLAAKTEMATRHGAKLRKILMGRDDYHE